MKDHFPDSRRAAAWTFSVRLAREASFNMDKLPSSEEIQALLAGLLQTMYIKRRKHMNIYFVSEAGKVFWLCLEQEVIALNS